MNILSINNLTLKYENSDFNVFEDLNFNILNSDKIALLGRSGSGKTSLLNIISGLIKPNSGSVEWEGKNINNLKDNYISKLRSKFIGFVFQSNHLLMDYTVLENVMLPNLVIGKTKKEALNNSKDLLNSLGLSDKINSYPSTLSGGQKQRVVIARALINRPKLILADEPTGSLDVITAESIMDVLLKIINQVDSSLLLVTHDEKIANYMDKKIILNEGKISYY